MMTKIEDQYLGDGVYASFDGYHIILDLRAQDSFTQIALEPEVIEQLLNFQKHIKSRSFSKNVGILPE